MTLTHANEVHTYMNDPNEENPPHTHTQKTEEQKATKIRRDKTKYKGDV